MTVSNLEVYEARVAYLDAAIAEITAVCNVVEAPAEKQDELRKIAQLAGDNAQQKFEAFTQLADRRAAGHED